MRTRILLILLTAALVAPAAAITAAQSAGAATVSTTPSWTDNSSGWDRSSSPTIADVNGDGRKEIVIGHENGLLHVINAANGRDLPGWPQQTGTAIDSTPAVGDLNMNGQQEIVVGLGSTFVPNQQGGVAIYNANGSLHCIYRTADYFNMWTNNPHPDGYADGVYSSPAIGDINGDGFPDIVFGGFDLHIHAIDRNCHSILSDNVEDTVWSSPALYDINGDGRLDILIGGDQSAGGAINWSGGEFRAIEYSSTSSPSCSNCREIWKHQLNDTMWSSPAIGDIDGDGRPEVIVGGGNYYNRADGHKVFAWHLDDGSSLPGWPASTSGSTMPSPALGDLDGNGIPEVVASSADGWVRAFNANGTVKWATNLQALSPSGLGGGAVSPIIADLNGDGHNDVGVGNAFGYFVLNGANGARMASLDNYAGARQPRARSPTSDPASAGASSSPDSTRRTTRAACRRSRCPTPRTTAPWPMFRRDPVAPRAARSRCTCSRPASAAPRRIPKSHPVAASSNGYWIVGADGSVYALKGAPFHGSASGKIDGTAVAIAATHSGNGYYLLDNSGGIFPFGDARSFGSMAGRRLNAPIIALAPTVSGRGYWLLASDGGVFSFGDARFYGSMGGKRLNQPIISIAATRVRSGLLAAGVGRWCVQLRRRALPRFDRQHPPRLARALDGDRAGGPGLLAHRR